MGLGVSGLPTGQRSRIACAIGLLAGGTLCAYAGISARIAFIVIGIGALSLWTVTGETNVVGYLATLAVQVFQSAIVFRVALADFFLAPAAARMFWRNPRIPRSTLTRPFVLLLAAFVLGNAVALLEYGHLGSYVLVNKDLGVLYLIVGCYTLVRFFDDGRRVERGMRWFVVGVSVANVTALAATGLAFAGIANDLYVTGNLRLYGWMLNPSLFGSILMTAAMMELALLGSPAARPRLWRWGNFWLFGLGMALTVSRGIWVAGGCAAAALLVVELATAPVRPRLRYMAVATAWATVPALTLAAILWLNTGRLVPRSSGQHASALQQQLAQLCRDNPTLDLCSSVQPPSPVAVVSAAPLMQPDVLPAPSQVPPTAEAARSTLTNARGLQDRFAIIGLGAARYRSSVRRVVTGIGLGTFYATSAADFGVPLIIHNTFAWSLFEMGPLGLGAVLWIWIRTSRNLWTACRAAGSRRQLSIGVTAAFVGMTVFCLFNDGFYQRHLWLLFALGDSLGGVPTASRA
jgi:hypothetical protein